MVEKKKKARVSRKDEKEQLDKDFEQARLAKANADLKELELARQRAESLDAKTVEKEWMKLARTIRAKVMLLPGELANELTGVESKKEIEEITRNHCEQTLRELSGVSYK
ncbi:MAG: hypothetical protein HRU19_28855 [Pseudobacteriovorax sp.]|nr:hypothetical protein [Pseudobacteriovorax sp.]